MEMCVQLVSTANQKQNPTKMQPRFLDDYMHTYTHLYNLPIFVHEQLAAIWIPAVTDRKEKIIFTASFNARQEG